jgi:hypothetical protein
MEYFFYMTISGSSVIAAEPQAERRTRKMGILESS